MNDKIASIKTVATITELTNIILRFRYTTLIKPNLKKKKIETRPIMSGNFLEQPVIKYISHAKHGKLDNSKLAMKNSFFFGNHHEIGRKECEYVVDAIAQFIERKLWKKYGWNYSKNIIY